MNVIEVSEKFPDDLTVVKFFERKRWKKGKPICPYCDENKISKRDKQDFRYKCYSCEKSFSVTVGTKLHNNRLPLKTWLFAFSIITDAKKGLSALQLQRNLNLSYPTSLKMYHSIREMMAGDNKTIDELEGIVEIDETFIGGKPRKFNDGTTSPDDIPTSIPKLDKRIAELKDKGITFKRGKGNPATPDVKPKRGRGSQKMIPVVGIVERGGDVVAQVMRNLTGKNLMEMVKRNVKEEDAVLISDQYTGYNRMDKIIEHIKIDHHRLYSYKGVNTNTIESFWAIIKRQIVGQHHHVTAKHLPKYVAEVVFKYNNRNQDDMFESLVKISMEDK